MPQYPRRPFNPFVLFALLLALFPGLNPAKGAARLEDAPGPDKRPNILIIMPDDQGYGDMSCHGNTILKTPAIDKLHDQSVRFINFHVDPTCSPTRAALLTGRYSHRTGIWHTTSGRSIIRPGQAMMPELFRAAGYRTGLFGKWHLGDNYPSRPQDRGFERSLIHGGGGIAQTPDAWGNGYFNPTLRLDGKPLATQGYCTKVFVDHALKFMEENRERPFLCVVTPNVPHDPRQVDEALAKKFIDQGVKPDLARFYAMVADFDGELGRMMRGLEEMKLDSKTIVIFLTDNGSAAGAFNAGMRGYKNTPYEGGHRVPCFIRWPGKIGAPRDIGGLTAHFDLLPTLMDLTGVPAPSPDMGFDGISLKRRLMGEAEAAERTLFVQSHRIHIPKPWRQSAVLSEQYRLINGQELYDVKADPGQKQDIAAAHPQVVADLRKKYEDWFAKTGTEFNVPARIVLGSKHENPSDLTCHDWMMENDKGVPAYQPGVMKDPILNGYWSVAIDQAGKYEITLLRRPAQAATEMGAIKAKIAIAGVEKEMACKPADTQATFTLDLPAGPTKLQTWLTSEKNQVRGAYFVTVKRLD